jgi:4'-phosphopantetheinyl transferase
VDSHGAMTTYQELNRLANRFLSGKEVSALKQLPAAAQRDAFFTCWTRKEAYIKARGQGLTIGLDHFAVSLETDKRPRLLHVDGQPGEVDRWLFYHLTAGEGYAAAMAVARHQKDTQDSSPSVVGSGR